ncbi:MAG: tetratricopeptide repeat protein [Maricaulaceae bacterium]
MATSGRASLCALAAFGALSYISLASSPAALADTPRTLTSNTRVVSYQDAIKAYESGDKNLALAYGKIAANNGDTEAQVLVGHILMRGETGLIDSNGAADVFKKAALKDHPDALVALSELALRSQAGLKPPDAIAYLERAATLGRHDAMRVLADVYYKGENIPKDTVKAAKWRAKAAVDGDALAARAMGDELSEKDPFEALQWYEHAATLGDPQSAYIAALMYAENFEIRPDGKKAAVLMRQAANANIAPAMADYGLLVYQGAGVEQSDTSAAKWFERAAKAGDSEGQFLYAFTLAKGDGIEQSFEDAYYWLLRSGESGVDDYNKDREALRERLEKNVNADILARARSRFDRTIRR